MTGSSRLRFTASPSSTTFRSPKLGAAELAYPESRPSGRLGVHYFPFTSGDKKSLDFSVGSFVLPDDASAFADIDAAASHQPPTSSEACHASRVKFLREYKDSIDRKIYVDKARDAIKLRKFAEANYSKNIADRVLGKLPFFRSPRGRLNHLKSVDVDFLMWKIENGQIGADRTSLTDLAKLHMMEALNFDEQKYADGIKKMARWEGVHSAVGRGVTFAASSVAYGIAPVINSLGSAAATASAKAVKFSGHHVPNVVLNPIITGMLRADTDVRKSSDNGGISKVTKNIEGASTLVEIRLSIREREARLKDLLCQKDAAENHRLSPGGARMLTDKYRAALCDAFLETHAAQHAYKERLGAAKANTWSKGYGMGVNGVAATAQIIGIAFPPAIPASIAIQGLCVPLQWAAGYADMHTAQAYNFRANVKYGNILKPEAQTLAYDRIKSSHIDQSKLKSMFQTAEAEKVALIREVYTDELGELHLKRDSLQTTLNALEHRDDSKARKSRPAVQKKLDAVGQQIIKAIDDAIALESFEKKNWLGLEDQGTIARCLENSAYLVKRAQQARRRKPGEIVAQVFQRYKQTYGNGLLSAGILIPAADLALNIDTIPGSETSHHIDADIRVPVDIAAATGAVTFTAATGIVRADKANDKKALAKRMDAEKRQEDYEDLKRSWTVSRGEGGKSIDLSHTGAFDRALHSRKQRLWRVIKTLPHGMFTSERAAFQGARARLARQQVKKTLRETLDLLQSEQGVSESKFANSTTMSAIKEDFFAISKVRQYLDEKRMVAPLTKKPAIPQRIPRKNSPILATAANWKSC